PIESTRMRLFPVRSTVRTASSTIPEGPAQSRTLAVVTTREFARRLVVQLPWPQLAHSLKKRVAKTYAKAGASSVIAMCKTQWRPIVPVAVEREIPVELAPELNVVGRIEIELNS